MTTVYLSSTYSDLKAHRLEVLDFFKPLREFQVLNMEGYVSENRTAYDKCLADVRSCDLYILIFGNNYGSIAKDPDDPAFNPEKLSYTELEYREAKRCGKEILLFKIAEPWNPAIPNYDKLQAFWTSVEHMLRPQDFDSPRHLALQVSQSIGNRFIKAQRINEKLVYLCDRVPQNSRFKLEEKQNIGPFRHFFLYGKDDELCGNFVNRIGYLHLSLDERKLIAPIIFDDFITSNNYDDNLQMLLCRIYELLHLSPSGDFTIASLIKDNLLRNEPLVLVLSADSEMVEDTQIGFLQRFLKECFEACKAPDAKPFYFFFNLEVQEGADPEETPEVLTKLKAGLQDHESFFHELPRLDPISKMQIKSWLTESITPDEGTALEILEKFFAELPKGNIPMRQAHKYIGAFISKMNAGAPETQSLINLY